MFSAKYINFGRNNVFLFQPGGNVHCDVAARLSKEPPVSAGFVRVFPNEDGNDIIVECYGESVSLGLEPSKEDASFIYEILKGAKT